MPSWRNPYNRIADFHPVVKVSSEGDGFGTQRQDFTGIINIDVLSGQTKVSSQPLGDGHAKRLSRSSKGSFANILISYSRAEKSRLNIVRMLADDRLRNVPRNLER